MNSNLIPSEYADIRPYAPDELPAVFEELIADEAFKAVVQQVMPQVPFEGVAAQLRQCRTSLEVQKTFFYPLLKQLLATCSQGISMSLPDDMDRQQPHTFISNHRDIVLDSAFLAVLLVENGFPTTVEIAIGDNLLIYPWIKKLVRVNKSFIVQRSLSMREMLRASQTMSRYMHFAVSEKHENIWIAQREGRAKDSNDRTQDSILKMMAMGGEGTVIERLKQLNICPLAISYEYDPCDFLKAQEFQQKRDIEGFTKSRADDLQNMQTGIFGQKGRIHYHVAPCINAWLDQIDPATPKTELFTLIAQHIDSEIHRHYRIYPVNSVAADLLQGTDKRSNSYNEADRKAFESYVESRIAKVQLPQPDHDFLRERILTMYANPLINQENA
ncbi:MAG: 1-acyl-sn-glycerol-3-phosphate acyltransferase [Bacteroidaceae bacterium]|nr:1-acyl-sn-glycerol-3-phosphate acyltransferase [Bacteroidaceae bacterium]